MMKIQQYYSRTAGLYIISCPGFHRHFVPLRTLILIVRCPFYANNRLILCEVTGI